MILDIKNNVSLGRLTTLGVGGQAKYFFEVQNKGELLKCFKYAKKNYLGILPIGIGSNVFFYNDIEDRLIIKLQNKEEKIISEEKDFGLFHLGAGISLPHIIMSLASKGYDLSPLSGYPSSIGGAVAVNSGLLGSAMGDYLESAEVLNTNTGEFETWDNKMFDFKYRYSKLKNSSSHVLYSCILKIPKGDDPLRKVYNLLSERSGKQPTGRCSGCFFKNPEGESAGKLIDDLGLKEFSIGGAYISEKHANFLMTKPNSDKQDLFDLKELVKDKVKEKYGIELEEEVVIY